MTTLWIVLVYAFVVVSVAFVGIGLYWLRPHH